MNYCKNYCQVGQLPGNFLAPLTRSILALMKKVLTTLAHNICASLLANTLAGKTEIPEREVIRASNGTIKAAQNFLMQPYPLTNFDIQK